MSRLKLEVPWKSLVEMESQLGIAWVNSVNIKEVNAIYNVATDVCLELMANYMMNELLEERHEIEFTHTEKQ